MLIALDGFEAFYEDHGSGTPLVLVHGLGGSTASWQKVVAPLSVGRRVIAYDLRGLGRSGAPWPPTTLASLVDDLHGLLEGLGLENVGLVGHSLGGAIVLAFAAEHPARVTAVVGVSAPTATPVEQRPALAERAQTAVREGMEAIAELHVSVGLSEAFRIQHPDDASVYRSVIAAGNPAGYAELCGVIADLDLTGHLGRITAPVQFVHGELDRVVPVEAARAAATAIPGCEYVELEGCGHVVPFERPGELAARVAEFVARRASA